MSDGHVNHHGHTTFSDGDGFMLPEDHVARVVELDQPAVALTEHGNISSHVQLERAAIAAGIKPIFGYEAYCESGDPRGQLKHHMTILASDATGYRNLQRLVTDSWENFKYKPTTTGEILAEHQEGLIVLSGCLGGRLATAMLGGKGEAEHAPDLKAASGVAARMRNVLGDRYYLEVQPHPLLERQRALNQGIARLSRKMGIPMVATGDVHYPRPEQQDVYPLLHAIARGGGKNTVEAQAQGWEYGIELTYHTAKQIRQSLRETGLRKGEAAAAVAVSLEIAYRCDVVLPKLKELVFPSDIPGPRLFRRLLTQGWAYRGFNALTGRERKVYRDRVRYELQLIESKGFIDYFLVVGDMVRWAKDNGIPVGPARGSAAASLVCYLLRITEVDPMLFPTLLFERFIDINRHDLPDIDLDFDDENRWRVREYLVSRYGAARVGNIGTFTMYRGKNSLESVARVYPKIPKWAVDNVKEKLIERSSGDLRGNATIEDTRAMFKDVDEVFTKYPELLQAQRLEGNIKGFSVHAAGLVVSQQPLTDSVAIYKRTNAKGEILGEVLSVDKYDAEYLNVLKIDVLGLTTMGVIRIILEMIGKPLEFLYRLPLDDEVVYEGFRRNEVIGIFQFDGRAMRSVNREVKPDTFMEVCDINALARPGPLHSGAAAEYIMVKHGKKKPERHGGVIDHITEHTNYQIVYQEQILQVVREVGGFTWEEAALIRKLISKKQGEQAFNRMMSKFMDGAAKKGVGEVVAARIWKQLVTAGAYAFNAAHCVSYGMLAYWTMWLKQHYPMEFYCASLRKYDPKTKGFDLLKEATSKGIKILPPHPQLSGVTWTIEDGALRAGLTQVKGIGEKLAPQMVQWREEGGRRRIKANDWSAYEELRGFGPKTTERIEEFCADEDPFGVYHMTKTLAKVRAWLKANADDAGLFKAPHRSEDVPYEAKRGEYFWLGVVRDRNLKDIYELHRSRTGEELNPEEVREPEYVNYCVITGEDETGPLVITVHRYGGLYEKFKDVIWSMSPDRDLLLVRGYKRAEYRRAIYATELYVLNVG